MPFTLAHPVCALPFKWIKNSWFSTTGLVVGSMAPDYEYFLKQNPSPTLSETLWGALLFDLPWALLVAFIFHLLVKKPLLRHLPSPYDRRMSAYTKPQFLSYLGKHWFIFISSLLIGIGSHLLLDWLTHPFSGPFKGTSFSSFFRIGSVHISAMVITERLFSVAAMLLLGYLLLKTNKHAPDYRAVETNRKYIYWSLFTLTLVALMVWEWMEDGPLVSFAKIITTFIWAAAAGLVVASVLIKLVNRQQLSTASNAKKVNE